MTPGRTLLNLKMAGHYGDETVSVLNLKLAKIDAEKNLLLIEGAIPGTKNGIVLVRHAVKLKVRKKRWTASPSEARALRSTPRRVRVHPRPGSTFNEPHLRESMELAQAPCERSISAPRVSGGPRSVDPDAHGLLCLDPPHFDPGTERKLAVRGGHFHRGSKRSPFDVFFPAKACPYQVARPA